MAIFNNMYITNAGQALYTKAQSGQQIEFTKMQVGSGQIGTQNPATLNALITPQFDVAIQSITANTDLKTATISGSVNNNNITQAVYICEIGLFANDPVVGEILYGYASAGTFGDYYAPSSAGPYTWNYEVNAAIGNAANVTAQLSALQYDYGVISTSTTFNKITGGNQKEINKSIDSFLYDLTNKSTIYTTTNTGNVYSVTVPNLTALTDGYPLKVKFNSASTGAISVKANSLSAVNVVDYFGNPVTNVRQNLIANLVYEATSGNFILLGKGGGGDVTADKMLLGITATGDNGPVTGTIPSKMAATYNPSTALQTIASGQYLSGTQTIAAVTGSATTSTVLSGYTFNSASGIGQTGNIPVNPGLISGTNHIASAGMTVGNNTDGNQRIYLRPGIAASRQCLDGDVWVTYPENNLQPGNIVSGVSILGVVGSAAIPQAAQGTVYTTQAGYFNFTVNCGFRPRYFGCTTTTGGSTPQSATLTSIDESIFSTPYAPYKLLIEYDWATTASTVYTSSGTVTYTSTGVTVNAYAKYTSTTQVINWWVMS